MQHRRVCSAPQLSLESWQQKINVYETMADIQYQADFGKLFKDNQNTKKNLFTLSSVRIANIIVNEMHRN